MLQLGTPLSTVAKRALLLGSGELGKEVVIELQRYGVEVIAVDRYANAPAMQVAHRSHVINMLDGALLRQVIEQEKPDFIIPEVEAIATPTLVELEKEGYNVIPTANATFLTMNRKGIRQLAHETLGLPTSNYRFAATREEFDQKLMAIVHTDAWIIDGNYQRTLPLRFEACTDVFFLDFPLEACLNGAASRIGTAREDMPWVEQEFDSEFRQYILDFQRDQIPKIYELVEQYRQTRRMARSARALWTSRTKEKTYNARFQNSFLWLSYEVVRYGNEHDISPADGSEASARVL